MCATNAASSVLGESIVAGGRPRSVCGTSAASSVLGESKYAGGRPRCSRLARHHQSWESQNMLEVVLGVSD